MAKKKKKKIIVKPKTTTQLHEEQITLLKDILKELKRKV